MALTIRNPTLTSPANKTQIEENFADVVGKFSAGITTAELSPSAGITNSQLANSYERLAIQFKVLNNAGTTVTVMGRALASLSAAAVGDILDLIPLPGDSSDTNWQIYDVSWACNDTGDGTTGVRIEWGYYSSTGVWTASTIPVAAWLLANANAPQDANDGLQVNSSATTLDFNHANGGNTPRSLALVLNAQGVGTVSAAGSFLVVTVLLRRQIQAS